MWFRYELSETMGMTLSELAQRMTVAEYVGRKGLQIARDKLAERQAAMSKR